MQVFGRQNGLRVGSLLGRVIERKQRKQLTWRGYPDYEADGSMAAHTIGDYINFDKSWLGIQCNLYSLNGPDADGRAPLLFLQGKH